MATKIEWRARPDQQPEIFSEYVLDQEDYQRLNVFLDKGLENGVIPIRLPYCDEDIRIYHFDNATLALLKKREVWGRMQIYAEPPEKRIEVARKLGLIPSDVSDKVQPQPDLAIRRFEESPQNFSDNDAYDDSD